MALPKEDEMLLAGRYDQALSKRGGSSPALNRMQSLDPAINPPPAPRNVTPAALTAKPAQRGGRGFAATPLASPQVEEYIPVPGASRGVAPMRNPTYQPSIVPPRLQAIPSAQNRTLGRPTDSGGVNLVQNANAASRSTPTKTPAKRVAPGGRPPPLVAPTALTPQQDPSGNFRRLTGKGATTALNSGNVGSATIQGRFLNKDGTRGPQETRAYTQGGIADAGKRVNVVPGLFSGVSAETEQALSAARQAAADRGDFEAVERSYADTPEKKAAYNQQAAETKILGAVGNAPLSQLPQVAQAVSGIQAGRTEAALGGQKVEEGEAAAQTLQAKRAIAEQLGALDPADTKGRSALIDELLAYDSKVQTPAKSLGYGALTDPTGMTPGMTYNKDTGQITQQGGAQGAPPPEHIQMLQGDPSKEAQAEFEAIYGPGSAALYLKQ